MRHRKTRLELNRFTSWRKATLRSLARNLLVYQSIQTTLSRAKVARSLAEKLISLARADTLVAKRQAFKILGDHKLVRLLFQEIGPRFLKRESGYTRIINLGSRRGDNARMVVLELTEIQKKEPKRPKKEAKAEGEKQPGAVREKEKPVEEKKIEAPGALEKEKEKPPIIKRPSKKFFGGIRNIFKKERDSL